jgi:hypothetical protein
MPRIPFDQLPSDARLWIFAAERPMSAAESARVLGETDSFINQWMAHGVPLTAGLISASSCWWAWTGARRVYPAVRLTPSSAACSSSSALGLELVNNGPVLYREGNAIGRVSRDRFAELAASGTVSPNTRVFDNTLTLRRSACGEVGGKRRMHGMRAFF